MSGSRAPMAPLFFAVTQVTVDLTDSAFDDTMASLENNDGLGAIHMQNSKMDARRCRFSNIDATAYSQPSDDYMNGMSAFAFVCSSSSLLIEDCAVSGLLAQGASIAFVEEAKFTARRTASCQTFQNGDLRPGQLGHPKSLHAHSARKAGLWRL